MNSMVFDGEAGYFLTVDEYEELLSDSASEEELEELRTEVSNLRNVIAEAYDAAHDAWYRLGNA